MSSSLSSSSASTNDSYVSFAVASAAFALTFVMSRYRHQHRSSTLQKLNAQVDPICSPEVKWSYSLYEELSSKLDAVDGDYITACNLIFSEYGENKDKFLKNLMCMGDKTEEELIGVLRKAFGEPNLTEKERNSLRLCFVKYNLVSSSHTVKTPFQQDHLFTGGTNLLHDSLTEGSGYSLFFHYFLQFIDPETEDDCGFKPKDLIGVELVRSNNYGAKPLGLKKILTEERLKIMATLSNRANVPFDASSMKIFQDIENWKRSIGAKDVDTVNNIFAKYARQFIKSEKERREREIELMYKQDQTALKLQKCILSDQCPFQSQVLPNLECQLSSIKCIVLTDISEINRPSPSTSSGVVPRIEIVGENLIVVRNFLSEKSADECYEQTKRVYESPKPPKPPNSLNRKGFNSFDTDFWKYTLAFCRKTKDFEKFVGVRETSLEPRDCYAFVISYEYTSDSLGARLRRHIDSSLWTVNVCLHSENCDNRVKFWVRPPCEPIYNGDSSKSDIVTFTKDESKYNKEDALTDNELPVVEVQLRKGDAVMHRGDVFHETVGDCAVGGGRCNHVIWFTKGSRAN